MTRGYTITDIPAERGAITNVFNILSDSSDPENTKDFINEIASRHDEPFALFDDGSPINWFWDWSHPASSNNTLLTYNEFIRKFYSGLKDIYD